MLLAVSAVFGGLALLVFGADRFVLGAASISRNLGVSPLIVGLTVVAFGTSAPEILVSIMASVEGAASLAIGNAIGSNVANIALVLGLSTLVYPMSVHSKVLSREFPVLLLITGFVLLLIWDRELNFWDGTFMMIGLITMITWLVRVGIRDGEVTEDYEAHISNLAALLWFLFGLIILLLSSRMLVWGAVEIARSVGVSELVIGLTIVAIGTSLPELAATLASALKKQHELAIGNVVGSNMFNLLGVMGIPGLFALTPVSEDAIRRDYLCMTLLTILLYFLAKGFRGQDGVIHRWEGALLTLCYIGYMIWIYHSTG